MKFDLFGESWVVIELRDGEISKKKSGTVISMENYRLKTAN
jgi:hypothetical protein